MIDKRLTIIAAVVVTTLFGIGIFSSTPTTLQAQEETPRIIAYGDSLIAGQGVSSSLNLPGQLQRLTGGEYSIINRGQSGAKTENLLNNLDARVLSENPDMVILFGGGADFIPRFNSDDRVPAEETFANLREIIDRLQDEDITVILIGHGSYSVPGFTVIDYTNDFRDLARDKDVYFVPEAMNDITLRSRYTNTDRVHPNARGYSVIAERVFPVFQEAIYEAFPDAPLAGSCQVRIESGEDRAELVFDTNETVMTNQQVEWRAYTVGGFGNYRYDWSIDGRSTSGRTASRSFTTEGNRTAEYTVTSSEGDTNRETLIECPQTIEVVTPPLKGSCSIDMNLDEDEVRISWNADISGGERRSDYEYAWRIDGDVVGTSRRLTRTYDRNDTGTKSATLSVISGPHDAELTCSTRIPGTNETVGERALRSASCDINGYDFEIGDRVAWEVDVNPYTLQNNEGQTTATSTFSWSGSQDLATTSYRARIAYTSAGVKTARADIQAATGEETFVTCEAKIVPDTDGIERGYNDGGCFIATAAFGTALAVEIDVLRNFRDEVLLLSPLGKGMVSLYYDISPSIADVIASNPVLRQITRWGLQPAIHVAGRF